MQCSECQTTITNTDTFCPECGVKINRTKEPELTGWDIFFLILLTIFIFPLGIIAWIVTLYGISKKKEKWRHEQLIEHLDNKA